MKRYRNLMLILVLAGLLLTGCVSEPAPTIAPSLPPLTEAPPPVPETESLPATTPATEAPVTLPADSETAPAVQDPTMPEEPISTQAPETEPIPTEAEGPIPGTELAYIRGAYAEPLSRYFTALNEQWDEGDYFDKEMSSLGAYYYEGDPLENVGFALIDLDKDGTPELIIGAIAYADVDPAVFEIWTVADGQAVKVVEGHPRNRYDLEYHPDQDLYMIRNHASNGAANFAMYYYRLQEGALSLVEGILFDATANADSPWFYTTDEDWNPGNDTEIDSESAMAVTDGHEAQITVPDYYPFTLF